MLYHLEEPPTSIWSTCQVLASIVPNRGFDSPLFLDFVSLEILCPCFGLPCCFIYFVFFYPDCPFIQISHIFWNSDKLWGSLCGLQQLFFYLCKYWCFRIMIALSLQTLVCLRSFLCQSKTVLCYYIYFVYSKPNWQTHWDVVWSKT